VRSGSSAWSTFAPTTSSVTEASRKPGRPSGQPPPAEQTLAGGTTLDLRSIAQEICERYREEFPDEEGRYGEAGNAWCRHDNQHILNWATLALRDWVDLEHELGWLARVLEARDFPLDRLARNLELGAEVVGEMITSGQATELAEKLMEGASFIRSKSSFLKPEPAA
jgi:hypothetical protein